MEKLKTVWDCIQNQILGMQWLNSMIGNMLGYIGLDINSQIGASVQFLYMMLSKSQYYYVY